MCAVEPAAEKPERMVWIFKVLLFVVALVVFMEGGARLVLVIHPLRKRIAGYDNSSYRLQWIGLHKIHLEWTGQYAIYHPIRGWTLKPNIKNMSVFDGKALNSNSKGLRGTTGYEYSRTPGKQRILVLGDSFTFGEEVSDDETYAHDLESALPNTEVLNLGVQGYGHDQMLLYLRDEGVKYHPDVVILGFAYLDIYRNLWTFFAYAKPRFKVDAGRLELTNVPVPTPEHVLAVEPYRPKALDLMVMLRDKLLWNFGKKEVEARDLTRWVLREIIATTRSAGAVPVFVYLPVYEEIQQPSGNSIAAKPATPPLPEREEYVKSICQEQGISCLFLGPAFRAEVERGRDFNSRGHWNPQAHKLAAEHIRDFLLKNNLIHDGSGGPPLPGARGR